MKFKNIHPWNLNPPGAIRIQNKLKRKIKLKKFLGIPKLVAEADVAFKRGQAIGAVVVLDYPEFKIIEQAEKFLQGNGKIYACGTCIKAREQKESNLCPINTMKDLYEIVKESDKVVTF